MLETSRSKTKSQQKTRTHNTGGAFVIELKIELVGIKPSIWRRIIVPNDITLDVLHLVLQGAMTWQNYHLHEFESGEDKYEARDESDDSWDPSDGRQDAKSFVLGSLVKKDDQLSYTYDLVTDGGISSPSKRSPNRQEDLIWISLSALPVSGHVLLKTAEAPILMATFSKRC